MSDLQRLDYKHRKVYSISENNAIGPTTSMTLRTLDNPTPTDLNAVFLAMNGSDAGANGSASTGTLAAPVLTLQKAIDVALAQPTRKTIHIIRNNYIGDLEFLKTTSDTSLHDFIFQVELGEIASIIFRLNGHMEGQKLTINGMFLIEERTDSLSGPIVATIDTLSGFSSPRIKWCYYKKNTDSQLSGLIIFYNTYPINSIFDNNYTASSSIISITADVTIISNAINCIFANFRVGGDPNTLYSAVNVSSFTSGVVNFDHCAFVNNEINLRFQDGSTEIKNSLFFNNGVDIICYGAGGSHAASINIIYSLWDSLNTVLSANNVTLTLTESNNQKGINALFFDALNSDFRLKDQRRVAPGTSDYFDITSKAVYNPDLGYIPGDDTRDLGPYDVSYTLISDTWESFEFADEYWNEKVSIDVELINHQLFNDKRGNSRRSFDGLKRQIELTPIQGGYIGTMDSYRFQDILRDDGAKRWYPHGDSGIFFEASGALTKEPGEWDWKTTLPVNWANYPYFHWNRWEGFICQLTSGAATYYLRITDNASGALLLEDHRENQATLSSGTYSVRALYLPVEIKNNALTMSFEGWNPAENPLFPTNDLSDPDGDYRYFEGHIRGISLGETEVDD